MHSEAVSSRVWERPPRKHVYQELSEYERVKEALEVPERTIADENLVERRDIGAIEVD